MNKKFFFWIVVLLIPVLLVPPFALHVSELGAVGIQHAFITNPPTFAEGISASTLFVEILAVLLIAFVLSKVKKAKDETVTPLKSIVKNILIWSIVMVIGLFATSEIIKYQKGRVNKASYNQGYEEGYKKRKISSKAVEFTNEEFLKLGASQELLNKYRITLLERVIKMAVSAGFSEEEIIVEKDFKELERLKKSLGIKPIYVFPK
ncbi:hypothetical protein HOB87_10740 [Candidatus Woesearchaeota archaeon]|jgi:ABC-type antimicrobial peptide transport system permease subunit|nr:hypothetical protein [Candidatus Woesearchaeota archaeon]